MPHLQSDKREDPIANLLNYVGFTICHINEAKGQSFCLAFCIEVLELASGIIFVGGSVCFLPEYAKDVDLFIIGCNAFVVGSVIYVVMNGLSLAECWIRDGTCWTLEVGENFGWVFGSVIFLLGTGLYFPDRETCQAGVNHHFNTTEVKHHFNTTELMPHGICHSLSQHMNKVEKEFWGTILFIAGSCIFVFATFFNALAQHRYEQRHEKMAAVIYFLFLVGSLLFCMGSVAFLPNVGCGREMVTIGAWMFIIGSAFFILGSCVSFWRSWILHCKNAPASREVPLSHRQEDNQGG